MSTGDETSAREAAKAVRDTLNDTNANVDYVTIHRAELTTVLEYAEAQLGGEPKRPFKVGDKVQEICDETGDDKPVGTVVEMGALGQHVMLENTRHSGRKLYYYDNEIELYVETPEPKFELHQKVELLIETAFMGTPLPKGKQGTIIEVYGPNEHHHEYEVVFNDENGSWSLAFDGHELKPVL